MYNGACLSAGPAAASYKRSSDLLLVRSGRVVCVAAVSLTLALLLRDHARNCRNDVALTEGDKSTTLRVSPCDTNLVHPDLITIPPRVISMISSWASTSINATTSPVF